MKLIKYFAVVASGLASFFLAYSTWAAEYAAPKQGDWLVRDFRFHTGGTTRAALALHDCGCPLRRAGFDIAWISGRRSEHAER